MAARVGGVSSWGQGWLTLLLVSLQLSWPGWHQQCETVLPSSQGRLGFEYSEKCLPLWALAINSKLSLAIQPGSSDLESSPELFLGSLLFLGLGHGDHQRLDGTREWVNRLRRHPLQSLHRLKRPKQSFWKLWNEGRINLILGKLVSSKHKGPSGVQYLRGWTELPFK